MIIFVAFRVLNHVQQPYAHSAFPSVGPRISRVSEKDLKLGSCMCSAAPYFSAERHDVTAHVRCTSVLTIYSVWELLTAERQFVHN
jgi:hypothetical protein